MSTFSTEKQTKAFLKDVKSPKQAVAQRTGIPHFVENDLTNTVDLHVAATNFTGIVHDFANELAAYLTWEYTKATNDPITEQIEFFKQLNNKTLSNKTNTGGKDSKIKRTLTVAIDVKLRPGERVSRDSTGAPVTRLVGTVNPIRQYQVENIVTKIPRWVNVEKNVLNEVKYATNKLKAKFGMDNMTEEFIAYWIDRFRKAHYIVRQSVLSGITTSKHYFQPLGDSIGSIARLDRVTGWNLTSLDIPLDDVDYNTVGIIPITHSPVIDDKIDPQLKKESIEFSQKTGAVFRSNMSKLVKVSTKSSKSHGEDLVPDRGHWDRMTSKGKKSLVQDLQGTIADTLGDVHKVLHYLRTSNDFDRKKIMNPTIEYAIEHALVKVDMFKNLIEPTTKKVRNKNVLGFKRYS
jgi:hypothetical protein